MGKMVSATEFKAKCLQLIAEMEKDGQPVTITRRGKVVAKMEPASDTPATSLKPAFGMLKSDRYCFDVAPEEPAANPSDWNALR